VVFSAASPFKDLEARALILEALPGVLLLLVTLFLGFLASLEAKIQVPLRILVSLGVELRALALDLLVFLEAEVLG